MYYTIYKIQNILNGKFYIGKHETKNLDDGYFGSGIALQRAVKKYGKENFVKTVLYIFDTEREMDLAERILVVVDFETSYNLGRGGEGGPMFKGKRHSEESKLKMLRNYDKYPVTDKFRSLMSRVHKGKVTSEETKRKISETKRLKAALRRQIHGKFQ